MRTTASSWNRATKQNQGLGVEIAMVVRGKGRAADEVGRKVVMRGGLTSWDFPSFVLDLQTPQSIISDHLDMPFSL
jgi:hypothetical protein